VTGPAGCAESRTALGAYAVGALDPAETAAVRDHLVSCSDCRREYDELARLVALLSLVPSEQAEAGPPRGDQRGLAELLARVDRERRHRSRSRRLLATAAAVVALALAVTGYLAGGRQHPTATVGAPPVAVTTAQTRTLDGTDPATGVRAEVTLRGVGWGSTVQLRLSHVSGPLTCSLVVVGNNGQRQVASTWAVPAGEYGGDGSTPSVLGVSGAVGLAPTEVARLEVVTASGQRLVSVQG